MCCVITSSSFSRDPSQIRLPDTFGKSDIDCPESIKLELMIGRAGSGGGVLWVLPFFIVVSVNLGFGACGGALGGPGGVVDLEGALEVVDFSGLCVVAMVAAFCPL